jgi:hypothetical protein
VVLGMLYHQEVAHSDLERVEDAFLKTSLNQPRVLSKILNTNGGAWEELGVDC